MTVIISGGSTEANVTVGTLPQVALQKGSRGLLPCQVQGDVDFVGWRKGPAAFTNQPLVIRVLEEGVWKKKRFDESGQFDMTSDFSLIIRDVDIHNEDFYSCTAKVLHTYDFLADNTDVSVFGMYIQISVVGLFSRTKSAGMGKKMYFICDHNSSVETVFWSLLKNVINPRKQFLKPGSREQILQWKFK